MERSGFLRSKIVGWVALIIILGDLILSMVIPGVKKEWWEMTDIFFFFMMAFSHLASLYLANISGPASRTLDKFSFIFGILGFLALIVIFFINNFSM